MGRTHSGLSAQARSMLSGCFRMQTLTDRSGCTPTRRHRLRPILLGRLTHWLEVAKVNDTTTSAATTASSHPTRLVPPPEPASANALRPCMATCARPQFHKTAANCSNARDLIKHLYCQRGRDAVDWHPLPPPPADKSLQSPFSMNIEKSENIHKRRAA